MPRNKPKELEKQLYETRVIGYYFVMETKTNKISDKIWKPDRSNAFSVFCEKWKIEPEESFTIKIYPITVEVPIQGEIKA